MPLTAPQRKQLERYKKQRADAQWEEMPSAQKMLVKTCLAGLGAGLAGAAGLIATPVLAASFSLAGASETAQSILQAMPAFTLAASGGVVLSMGSYLLGEHMLRGPRNSR